MLLLVEPRLIIPLPRVASLSGVVKVVSRASEPLEAGSMIAEGSASKVMASTPYCSTRPLRPAAMLVSAEI